MIGIMSVADGSRRGVAGAAVGAGVAVVATGAGGAGVATGGGGGGGVGVGGAGGAGVATGAGGAGGAADTGGSDPGGVPLASSDQRGAERHGMLRMCVERDGTSELGTDELGDERDTRRPADEQDRPQLLCGHAGRAECAFGDDEGVAERGADHRLELGSGEPDLCLHRRQDHRDRDVGVARERLLRPDALVEYSGHRRLGVQIVGIEPCDVVGDGGDDVSHDRLVEVDATESFDALGFAEQLESLVGGDPHDRDVERAAAQVVHGDDVAGIEAVLCCVVDGGRLRLVDQHGIGEVGSGDGLAQQLGLVRTQFAGWATAMAVGASPSRSLTSATTASSWRAISASTL